MNKKRQETWHVGILIDPPRGSQEIQILTASRSNLVTARFSVYSSIQLGFVIAIETFVNELSFYN